MRTETEDKTDDRIMDAIVITLLASVVAVAGIAAVRMASGAPPLEDMLVLPDPVEECYKGECEDCKDCSKEINRTNCYLCCMENCPELNLKCQARCDEDFGGVSFIRTAESLEGASGWLRTAAGRPLTLEEMRRLELIWLRNPDPGIQRVAIAIYGEAWGMGRAPATMAAEVESAVQALFTRGDYPRMTAALAVMQDGWVRVDGPGVALRLARLVGSSPEPWVRRAAAEVLVR